MTLTTSTTDAGTARLCHACGRTWRPTSRATHSAWGLKLRRVARHAGVRADWAHPRPVHRCPTCTSDDVTTVRPLLP